MKECCNADIGVTTDAECEAYCDTNGMVKGFEISNIDDVLVCTCLSGPIKASSTIPSPTPGGTDNYQDLPSCASVNVAQESLTDDCTNLCSPLQATDSKILDETDTAITQVFKFACSHYSTGCEDRVVLADKLAPLPTCNFWGIERIDQCGIFCNRIAKNIGRRR